MAQKAPGCVQQPRVPGGVKAKPRVEPHRREECRLQRMRLIGEADDYFREDALEDLSRENELNLAVDAPAAAEPVAIVGEVVVDGGVERVVGEEEDCVVGENEEGGDDEDKGEVGSGAG